MHAFLYYYVMADNNFYLGTVYNYSNNQLSNSIATKIQHFVSVTTIK
ncbi:Unknown protein sequence [Pseudomonas coronafaciens pv. oryzae]|nr:Unknown protein sequence [Pseudomonas coronafaciens pv. oryzae]